MRVGVDVIDMDINTTKDKVLVVTHDLTLNPDPTKTAMTANVEVLSFADRYLNPALEQGFIEMTIPDVDCKSIEKKIV